MQAQLIDYAFVFQSTPPYGERHDLFSIESSLR